MNLEWSSSKFSPIFQHSCAEMCLLLYVNDFCTRVMLFPQTRPEVCCNLDYVVVLMEILRGNFTWQYIFSPGKTPAQYQLDYSRCQWKYTHDKWVESIGCVILCVKGMEMTDTFLFKTPSLCIPYEEHFLTRLYRNQQVRRALWRILGRKVRHKLHNDRYTSSIFFRIIFMGDDILRTSSLNRRPYSVCEFMKILPTSSDFFKTLTIHVCPYVRMYVCEYVRMYVCEYVTWGDIWG